MTEKEDEQLLEDASTLLMFAAVAARQRSPDPLASSDNKDPVVKTKTPPASTPPPGANKDSKQSHQPSDPQTIAYAPLNSHLPPMVPMNAPPHSYQQIPAQKLAGTDQKDAAAPSVTKPYLPHILPAQPVLQSGLAPPGYSYYPYGYSPGHSTGNPSGQPPQLGAPMLFATPHGQTAHPDSNTPPQKFSPQISPSLQHAMFQNDSSKVVTAAPAGRAQSAYYLPRQANLPAQGNFQTHRKSSSTGHQPENTQGKGNTPVASPIPANVALSRGINVETGKRNSENAMIAAAALAAAAEVPLPLKNKDERIKSPKEEPQKDQKSNVKDVAIPPTTPIVKTEDSVMTEPEDDENRTEDEPESRVMAMDTAEERAKGSNADFLQSASTTAEIKDQDSSNGPIDAPATEAASIDSAPPTTKEELPNNSAVTSPASTKSIKQPKTKVSFQPPPLSEFKVDPDSGIIGCICGIEEDDGFTIQCDVCFRWQHCSCMGYKTNDEVPEDVYKCYYCDETKWNKFDPKACRADTLARLGFDKGNESPFKPAPPKRKTLNSGGEEKKRRKSEKDLKSSDKIVTDKRKSSATSVNLPVTSPTSATFDINNKDNPLLEGGVSVELYQSVYYKLTDYDYKTADVKKKLEEWGREFKQSGPTGITIMSPATYKAIKFSKVNLPNYQKYLQDRNELRRGKGFNDTSVQAKAYSDNPKQKFIGISKMGLFITSRAEASDGDVIPAGTAVTEYLGEVDLLELYMGNRANQYPAWGTVKPQVARVDLELQKGTDPISIVIDARFVGNEARFIRKSCATTANCEIRSIYIPQLQTFKHVVYTTRPITLKGEDLEEELRLKWEWDQHHPINKMIEQDSEGNTLEGLKFEDFSDEDKVLLVSGVDTILNFVECACNTTSINLQCSIFKIKKATSYLLRSTRKASSLTNIAFNKSKEELVMPKKSKQFVSWKERLSERDNLLHMSIFSVSASDDNSETSVESDNIAAEDVEGGSDLLQSPGDEASEQIKRKHKLPYRQQLYAKGRKFASRKYVTDSSDTSMDAVNHVPKTIAVPLASDIILSIKEAVNNTLKPLAKISSNVNIVNELAQPGTEEDTSQPTWKEASPGLPVAAAELPLTETKPVPPPVVKKLSFADYKKKMK